MDKPSHLTFRLRTFTSDEIDAILEAGGNFRQIRLSHRDNLLGAMRAGQWECGNGETIVLNGDGGVLNGQHRLSAAAIYQRETNDPVWFLVVSGADKKIGATTDVGLPRRLKDFLLNEGVVRAAIVAAIAMGETRMRMSLDKKTLYPVVSSSPMSAKEGGKQMRPVISLTSTIESWRRHKSAMSDWSKIGLDLQDKGRIPRSASLAAMGFQLAKSHDMEAKLFFDYLTTGAGMKADDPILMLRKKLHEDRMSIKKFDTVTIAAYFVKTWVAWNEGRTIGALKWQRVGPRAEAFPTHAFEAK